MPVLSVPLNCLFAALQKTVTFPAGSPHFGPKLHPPAHHEATMWVYVGLMSFCRYRPSSIVHRHPFFIPHPSSLLSCGGNVGVFSLEPFNLLSQKHHNLPSKRPETASKRMFQRS
jgi:hypothetical protein